MSARFTKYSGLMKRTASINMYFRPRVFLPPRLPLSLSLPLPLPPGSKVHVHVDE